MVYHWFFIALIVSSLLSLQLGISYWISGGSLGFLAIVLCFLFSASSINIPRVNGEKLILWASALILSVRIILESERLLLQLRIIFFMIAYVLSFTGPSLTLWQIRHTKIIASSVINSAAIVNLLLFLSIILSFLPGTPFNPSRLVIFLDRWLVTNKTFETVDQALKSIYYQANIGRISLFYGEPSYLALVIGVCTYVILLGVTLNKYQANSAFVFSLFSRPLLFSLFILGLLMLVVTGSFLGFLFFCFLLTYFFLFFSRRRSESVYVIAMVCSLVLPVATVFLLDLPFIQLFQTRFASIVGGTDLSSSGRIYPFVLFFQNIFGYGSSLQVELNRAGFPSVDSGVVSHLLLYGVFFASYFMMTILVLRSSFGGTRLALSYCIFLTLSWSQSGNIFTADKFFLSLLPLPLLMAHRNRAPNLQ
jgi:hypothetical protein